MCTWITTSAFVVAVAMFWRYFRDFERSLVLQIGLTVLTFVTICGGDDCRKATSCSCDGGSYFVDLHPLTAYMKADHQLVTDELADDNYLYSWQPCEAFTENDCKDVAGCQLTEDKSASHSIGSPLSATFGGDATQNTLYLLYTGGDEGRQTNVSIQCGSSDYKVDVLGETESGSKIYKFVLHTKYACVSSGLSVGSILLIIFFVCVLIYIIGGFIFLRFCRGARGVEQVPNYEFWSDFPLLIKDGVLFTMNGCKTSSQDATYEKI